MPNKIQLNPDILKGVRITLIASILRPLLEYEKPLKVISGTKSICYLDCPAWNFLNCRRGAGEGHWIGLMHTLEVVMFVCPTVSEHPFY